VEITRISSGGLIEGIDMRRYIGSTTDRVRIGLGIITNAVVAIYVLCVTPCGAVAGDFLYTNNNEPYSSTSSTVSAFTEESGGGLTELQGSPFDTHAAGLGGVAVYASQGIAISSNGPFLFVADGGGHCDPNHDNSNGCVSAFKLDPDSGSITFLNAISLPAGYNYPYGPMTLAVTPDGHFLYAASFLAEVIYRLTIAPDGTLAYAGYGTTAQYSYYTIAVSPDGKFLAAGVGNAAAVFSIGNDGSLTPVPGSPYKGAGNMAGVDFNCSSTRLYAGEYGFDVPTVDVFSVAENGVLAPLVDSPYKAIAGANSNIVLLSPDEKYLYVSNQFSASITVFSVNSYGGLSVVSGSPFPLGTSANFPTLMATNTDGTLLYVIDPTGPSNGISVLNVAANGALTPVGGLLIPTTNSASIYGTGTYPIPHPHTCTPPDSAPEALPYATFNVLELEVNPSSSEFSVSGELLLGTKSDGIDPTTEDIKLVVGDYSTTIPAGSVEFVSKGKNKGTYAFVSQSLELGISLVSGSQYSFSATVSGAVPGTGPMDVSLTMGNDGGNTVLVTPKLVGTN
jgi:6-phosphogluconolactonase (cycloisomerase 2 family)